MYGCCVYEILLIKHSRNENVILMCEYSDTKIIIGLKY